ncbi:unnamed protein product [Fraxinus pennsylvanica]|uniref:MLO-like protein n=1 Tax=Fraxinus pennsylvanica TaxID=56036 RepID=A0AAD1YPN8_9LAMI|nr:unnamed protein product [Fraxinus pennsylvanica]
MSESKSLGELENSEELRSLALTPTWSVASVLTIFVAVSLLVERTIHSLCNWLKKTNRKPLLAAVEKMKEELMLLGFISLLLTATSSIISNICIPSKFYNSAFAPCTMQEVDEERENKDIKESFYNPHSHRRVFNVLNQNTCRKNYEPFVSYEGLEQLHRFIFVMAITHISYSCLTMLLAIVKIHSWRVWEDEAHMDRHDSLTEITSAKTMQRQSTFVRVYTSTPTARHSILIWATCFFRQFGRSVVRADYLSLRKGFITNHNLTSKYDFHSYMVRSMEEEFQRIVGVRSCLTLCLIALDTTENCSVQYFEVNHQSPLRIDYPDKFQISPECLTMIYSKFLDEVPLLKATSERSKDNKRKRARSFDLHACADWWKGKSDLSKKLLLKQVFEKDVGLDASPPSFDRGCLASARRKEKIKASKLRIQKIMHPLVADSGDGNDICAFKRIKSGKKQRKNQFMIL